MSGANSVHLSAQARHMVGMRLSALRLPFRSRGESICFVVGKARAQGRVARTIFHIVIAGLDPAIHARCRLALSSLPGLTRQSMRDAGLLRFAAACDSLRINMDHRVKPGGDD